MIQLRSDLLNGTSAKVKSTRNPTFGKVVKPLGNNSAPRYNPDGSPTWKANPTPAAPSQNSGQSGYVPGSGISVQSTQQNSGYAPGTYIVDGKVNQGYIKDGRTYTDQNYTQRVPVGATVYTSGGRTYRMGVDGGAPTEQTILNDYNSMANGYIDEYRASRDAYDKKVDADVQAALDRISAQQAGINRERDAANRASYGAYLQAVNPYGVNAQRMAAIGLDNSGYSETSMLSAGNTYQQAINENELARISAIEELNRQANEAVLAGQGQKAEAYAEYARYLASLGMQNAQYASDLSMNAANSAYGKERDQVSDTRYDAETAYNHLRDDKNDAWTALSNGYFPSNASGLLGIPQEEFDAAKAEREKERAFAEWLRQNEKDEAAQNSAYRAAQIAKMYARGKSSGSGRGKSSGSGNTQKNSGGGNDNSGYYPKTPVEDEKEKANHQAAVFDMLQRWYNVNSEEKFQDIVERAIASGQLTKEEFTSWLKSKGLL